jgi:hypothetical protein
MESVKKMVVYVLVLLVFIGFALEVNVLIVFEHTHIAEMDVLLVRDCLAVILPGIIHCNLFKQYEHFHQFLLFCTFQRNNMRYV